MDNQVDNHIEKLLRNNVGHGERGETKLIEILNVAINSIAQLEQKVDAIAYQLDTISPVSTPIGNIHLHQPYHSTPNSTDSNHDNIDANLITPIIINDVTPNFTTKTRNASYEHAVEDYGNRSDSIYPSGISYSVDKTPPVQSDQFNQRRESLINVIKNLVTLEEKVEGLYRKSSVVEIAENPKEAAEFAGETIEENQVDVALDGALYAINDRGTVNTKSGAQNTPTMTISEIQNDIAGVKEEMRMPPGIPETTYQTELLLTIGATMTEQSNQTHKSIVYYKDVEDVKDELKSFQTSMDNQNNKGNIKTVRYLSETFNDIDDVKNEIQASNVQQDSTNDKSHPKDTNRLFSLGEHELPSYIKHEIGGALLSQMALNELEMSQSGPPMRVLRYATPDEPWEDSVTSDPQMIDHTRIRTNSETGDHMGINAMKEIKPIPVTEFMIKAQAPKTVRSDEPSITNVTNFWISPHASDEEDLPAGKTKPPPLPDKIVIETGRYRTVPNDLPNTTSPTPDKTDQKLHNMGKIDTKLNKPSKPLPPYRPIFRVIPAAKGPERFGPAKAKPYDNTEYEVLVDSVPEPNKAEPKTGLVVLETHPAPKKKEHSLKDSNRPPTPLRLFDTNATRTHSNNTDISDNVFSSPLTVQHIDFDDEHDDDTKQQGDDNTTWDNPEYRRNNWTKNINPLFNEIPIITPEPFKETGPDATDSTQQDNDQQQVDTADEHAPQHVDIPKDVAKKIKDGKGSVRHNTPSPRAKALDLLSKQKQYKDNFYDKQIPYTADSGDYKAVTFNRAQFRANWLDTNTQNENTKKNINGDIQGKAFVVTGRNTTESEVDKTHSSYTHAEIPFIKDKESKLKAKLLCCAECRSEAIVSLMQDGEATLV
ncbi:unnamed protein product [Owenia fusiformis]|uniref:Uncharacterized protein n=1 Tax=Owenia fusiformis TaxID=6347 RepID=A0A8S4MZI2_OWEFU|nr:unnamed protein product [Owenia fusiformis]